jgi:hypothetical protein
VGIVAPDRTRTVVLLELRQPVADVVGGDLGDAGRLDVGEQLPAERPGLVERAAAGGLGAREPGSGEGKPVGRRGRRAFLRPEERDREQDGDAGGAGDAEPQRDRGAQADHPEDALELLGLPGPRLAQQRDLLLELAHA